MGTCDCATRIYEFAHKLRQTNTNINPETLRGLLMAAYLIDPEEEHDVAHTDRPIGPIHGL